MKVSKQRFEELLESEVVHFARALRPHPVQACELEVVIILFVILLYAR